jgi:hypothetical protein
MQATENIIAPQARGETGADLQEIKAAVLRKKGGPFEFETLHLEGPRADEVLVRRSYKGNDYL